MQRHNSFRYDKVGAAAVPPPALTFLRTGPPGASPEVADLRLVAPAPPPPNPDLLVNAAPPVPAAKVEFVIAALLGRTGLTVGRPIPGTLIPQCLASTICRSCTSNVSDPRCLHNRRACRVTLSRKSSASCRTCSSASRSMT